MFEGKKILVTGGTGMIGIPLVKKLVERGGVAIKVASLDKDPKRRIKGVEYVTDVDLTSSIFNCMNLLHDIDYVFHLAGIKGSPKMCAEKPASFFVPLLQMNTNMMEAARRMKIKRYLYTSSIGAYTPANTFYEDDMWKGFPSKRDKFAGWAKRMGELQAEAYAIQYNWNVVSIVRPANVYGPFDNFDSENGMVIPSLIARATKENPLIVWGNGSVVRDFIYADDVAEAMIKVFERAYPYPVNLGSGEGTSIGTVARIIAKEMDIDIKFDPTKPSGDQTRLMDIARMKKLGANPKTSIEEGIKKTIKWYSENKIIGRYNAFKHQ